MADILSQAEIDALLNALSAGEVDAEEIKQEEKQKKVKIYDFKRPNKFSKDQIHTLQVIHENFSRLLTTYFSAHLRSVVQISVLSVEQLTYEEFVRSIPNPTILNIITLEPLEGNAIFEIDPDIGFSIIDRMFGGPGEAPEKIRPLTDIERTANERVTNRALDFLKEAWESIIDFQPKLEMTESNPQFTQIVSPTEMCVLITLETKIGAAEGMINLCLPYLVLEPIISKLSTHFWFNRQKDLTRDNIDLLQKKIEKANVPICVELGHANITVRELLEIQVGDVLKLNTLANDHLGVYVGSRKKYTCLPGVKGSKMAVQVTAVVDEGDESND
jgi:flagellar motor switch protein FliM